MKIIEVFIVVFLVFGFWDSKNITMPISGFQKPIRESELEKSWRIEEIAEYKYDEKLDWYPSKLTIFHYKDDNHLEGTVSYNNYSVESEKYATRIENRNSRDLDFITKMMPLRDSNLENWSKEEGSIFLKNSKENKFEDYQFRFSSKSNKWVLYGLMKDTFENNKKTQRYFYTDIDPGNYPIQENMVIYKYNDSRLLETISMWKKVNERDAWRYSRKESFEYQDNTLRKRELFFYSDEENKWNLTESEEFLTEGKVQSKIFFEYHRQNRTKSGYKVIEKRNASEIIEEKIHLNWKDRESRYEHFYTEKTLLRGDLALEVIQSYTHSDYYDKYGTFNRFDSLNRLISSEKKTKNDEDVGWKYLSGVSLFYDEQNEIPSSIQKIDAKGKISEDVRIIFDSLKNPIRRISNRNGRKMELEIIHDYSIDSENIVNLDELELLTTNLDDNTWRHNKAPIERIYFRINNGKKIKYKKIEYTFKEIE